MNSHLGAETTDERTLFEQAKAKLEEAFTLLQSLEGRMQNDVGRTPIDAAQRAEERERLLAYVEHAQSEALRLARRSRRLSRIRVRAKAQADLQRPADNQREAVPEGAVVTQASPVLTVQTEVAPIPAQIVTERAPALDGPTGDPELDDVDLSKIEVEGATELDTIERAFEVATLELSGRLSLQRELTPERIARSRADTLIGRYTDLADEDLDISDAEIKAFEDAMSAATSQHTRIEWWPAAAEQAEQEKAGARMRRDRTPTERMERPTVRPALHKRLMSVRAVVVGLASLTLLLIVGFTVRATMKRSVATVAAEQPQPFVGPPSELAVLQVEADTQPAPTKPKVRLAREGRHRPRR